MERLNFDILDENHDVTALEMLSTQIGGEWSASRAKENYWTLLESEFDSGSTSHLFDTRDLTAWSQQYRDDKCTKQLYSVWIFPVNYKEIMNRHAHRIDQSTYVLTASWLGLRRRRSVLLNAFLTLRIVFTIYPFAFSSATVVVFYVKKKKILNEVRVDTSKPSLKLVDCGSKLHSYRWILLETRTHNLMINQHNSF